MMERTVELGRAVLSLTTTNLELWLTTLITISPKQHTTNFQQLRSASLIDFLSSGETWVDRGNGMHMVLEITLRGEHLESDKLRRVAEGIVKAPAWEKLNLQLSLPLELHPQPGRIHINIAQLRGDTDADTKKGHRIYADVPSADVKPPEGMPTASLQSIHFALVFSESRAKSTSARQKLQKQQRGNAAARPNGGGMHQVRSGAPDMSAEEDPETVGSSDGELLLPGQELSLLTQSRKRKRPLALPNRLSPSQAQVLTMPAHQKESRRPHTGSAVPVVCAEITDIPESQLIQDFVDAAVRLSVFGTLRGTAAGCKIKANTFAGGLAEVAPTLWRPGYIEAITQRAHLIPSLSLSLGRIGSRAQSLSLQNKIGALVSPLHLQRMHSPSTLDANTVASAASAHIWIHAQRSLTSKPPSVLNLVFCMPTIQPDMPSEDDEILEVSDLRFCDDIETAAVDFAAQELSDWIPPEFLPDSAEPGGTGDILFAEDGGLTNLVDLAESPGIVKQTIADPINQQGYLQLASDNWSGVGTSSRDGGCDEDLFATDNSDNDVSPHDHDWFYEREDCGGTEVDALQTALGGGILTF
ncbi:hypothetical protein CC80DRAFT_532772 [Byssothecium circinans]|uniref:Uncharacterized protein n=1 Tax=Byssothecium circinans TaxID=147558 RepID=A0A6A5U7H2_9PLEO|nr:hypothetical protein CC80DRAFT_532772 [Byssothecium circinans]